jgi:D-tyrosyl-tRNA(Tyr) deacylase
LIGLLQRVRQARVEIDGAVVGAVGQGLLVFFCAEPGDGPDQVARFVDKVLKLRVFADEAGRMNRSISDVGGGLLLVSQFTLAADTRSGNRPGFSAAAPPEQGRTIFDAVVALASSRHPVVATGCFGADMQVHLVNDGPVTIPLRIEPAVRP